MKRELQIFFKRHRIENGTISLEPELIALMKSVFGLETNEEVKEFVKRLTKEANFNSQETSSYSQEIKRLVLIKVKERYDTLYSLIQSIIQSKLIK